MNPCESSSTIEKKTMWDKPTIQECCPRCHSALVITSIIHENEQVNFVCNNYECPYVGFIHLGKIYFAKRKYGEEGDVTE